MSDKDKKKVEELKKKHKDVVVPDKDIKSSKSFKESLKDIASSKR